MKIVVDTNILVSAILRGRMPKRAIQSIIDRPDWKWLVIMNRSSKELCINGLIRVA
ncbi:hypothetical protein [Microcoleus sp. herbarium14]|uniref:hypothetical protein n=1 Tax=Microcoleus sp. herbarium14 TaxID=3055439 RepID=UPI002FD50D87